MRKYSVLITFTSLLILAIYVSGSYLKSMVVAVDTISLNFMPAQDVIACSGQIEYSNTKNICASETSIVSEVYVKDGDVVSEGETLVKLKTISLQKSGFTPSNSGNMTNLDDLSNIPEIYRSILESEKNKVQQACAICEGTDELICSPMSGIVGCVNTEENIPISPGVPIIKISDPSELQVRLAVDESQISDVKIGQKVIITGVGFKNSVYEGTVKNISKEAKQIISAAGKETAVDVIVSVNSGGEDIKAGFTAKCKIIISERTDALIAPFEAVQADDNGREFVYKCENGKSKKSYITTGEELDSGFEVCSGLCVGDVIVSNAEQIYEGATLKRKKYEGN